MDTTEVRPKMGTADLIRYLKASSDPLLLQLAENMEDVLEKQEQLRGEAQSHGEPSKYAAVRVGGVVELLTANMHFPEFDPDLLSDDQRAFFERVQKSFPGIVPLERHEGGGIVFHGMGRVGLLSPTAEIADFGLAPACPQCAEDIMRQLDAGRDRGQCGSCGNSLVDVS